MQYDGNTIHELAEYLFEVGSLQKTEGMTKVDLSIDPTLLVKHTSVMVTISQIPQPLRDKITPDVERQTRAFLEGLGILCKVIDDPELGRSFEVDMPGELSKWSWEQFRNSQPKWRKGV